MKNFYVDYLLKSTPSAISLIKAVTKMYNVGGFKLGTFISNKVSSGRPKKGRVSKMLT